MSDFLSIADIMLGIIIVTSLPAYPLLQLWATRHLPNRWRFAAMLPLACGTLLLAHSAAAVMSHAGLSVVPLIFFAPAALLYLLVIVGARLLVLGHNHTHAHR